MSRIGKKPIEIPSGVELAVSGNTVKAKGPKGELSFDAADCLEVKVEGSNCTVERKNEEKFTRAIHGTTRSIISNMVEGVSKGYTKELEINGVGYRAQQQGTNLVLSLGFSHNIDFQVPDGVTVNVKDGVNIEVTGADKQLVGQVSARLRNFSPAEPYKGKGVKYKDEQIRRKAGKTVA